MRCFGVCADWEWKHMIGWSILDRAGFGGLCVCGIEGCDLLMVDGRWG